MTDLYKTVDGKKVLLTGEQKTALEAEWAEFEEDRHCRETQEQRCVLYPPMHEQLDMLWHDINDNIIPGKDGRWFQYIAEIKEACPLHHETPWYTKIANWWNAKRGV